MVSDSAKIYIVPPGQVCDLRDIERVKAYRCGDKDGLQRLYSAKGERLIILPCL